MAAFLMILGGILGVVAKLGEYLVPPIKRQFDYMCCYGNNIKDLQHEADKLLREEGGIRLQVELGKMNLEKVGPDVENWLKEVQNTQDERCKLQEDAANIPEGCIHGGCANLIPRYHFSKRAKKITQKAIQLRNEAKFDRLSHPVPFRDLDLNIASQPMGSENKFSTRKFVEEKIIATLMDSNVKMMGLCGMGGVGKTTMVRRIGKLVKEKEMFDEIVMATVTHHPDQKRIQTEIAEMLNLKLQAEHVPNRGILLRRRIMDVERILVILDDVWGNLDLDSLGIPLTTSHNTCKILLTSRAQDVCVQMGADKTLQLQVLSREEAWILFSEESGTSIDCTDLYPIARDVANECKGLPVALVTVARALKQKCNRTWENALTQLRKSIPTNILGVQNDVYKPLELSYSALEGNEAKNLFLLCSLFQEGSDICIENLVRYGIGLNIFKGIDNIREGRIRTHALVEILKDRFLLLDGRKKGFVMMHDVVRDVAISIASKDGSQINDDIAGLWVQRWSYLHQHCTRISLFSNFACIREEMNIPNLIFLLRESFNKGPLCTFEKFTTLKVLDLQQMDIPVVPSSIQKLSNLRAMHLRDCNLEDLSIIGEMIGLEILYLRSAGLEIFPAALGKLANLRLLDLTGCENLQEIEQGAVRGLVRLEELYMTNKFSAWGEVLAELESLPNLTTLRLLIANLNVISRNIDLHCELKEYDISIQAIREMSMTNHPSAADIPHKYQLSHQKVMDLYLPQETHLGDWISSLLMRTEDLKLRGDGSSNIVHSLGLGGFQHLKQLEIQDCKTVEHLVSTINGNMQSFDIVFPVLETLYLHQVSNMVEICIGQFPARSFGKLRHLHLQELNELKHFCSRSPSPDFRLSNLRSIYIYKCRNLRSLFSNSVAQGLWQLEELDVGDCPRMDTVFFEEYGQDRIATCNMEFPKLEKLVLRCLHRLTSFTTGIDRISFPQLRVLKMEGLQRFDGFGTTYRDFDFSSWVDNNMDRRILFNKKVDCPRIKTLSLEKVGGVSKVFSCRLLQELEFMEVDDCSELNTIFSPSIAPHLLKLKELRLRNCCKLEQVVEKEDDQQVVQVDKINSNPFPQLRYLVLLNLPNLKNFWNACHDFEIPSLRTVMADSNSTNMESLAKNALLIGSYRNTCRRCVEERALPNNCSPVTAYNQTPQSGSTLYASCRSYICHHKEERRDGDSDCETPDVPRFWMF
ncbi:probable disease resistance protein At4g27220 [Henckelia pumila]|uniref:probable disease resistance protein At4g27220 n=1 Tax=Henckelia pumila TaxID=405737 RepID=UPI003C6E240C